MSYILLIPTVNLPDRKYRQTLAESALDVIIKVNPSAYTTILKEEQTMNDIVRKQFHVDELEQTIAEQKQALLKQSQVITDRDNTINYQNQLIAQLRAQLAQAGVK